jgi:hypothetical protein
MRNLAVILLAIWLIAIGLLPLLNVQIQAAALVLNILAVAAGFLLLIGSNRIKMSGRFAILLLGIYLILAGLLPLLSIDFPASGIVLAVLAIAAGVFLLLRR